MRAIQPESTERVVDGGAGAPRRLAEELPQYLALAAIFVLTFVAYSPVLFNFFNGDDFVHLTWLAQAIHQPELVWRNFHSSWLDGTTTKFYRPLISVFMVSDYALYGANGLGFRITNLLFHLSSTVWIYFIGRHLLELGHSQNPSLTDSAAKIAAEQHVREKQNLWPLAAAALFALYPLHPEAVSWITGRVDSVVTAFCLGAVFFYMRYSKTGKVLYLALCLVATSLGLMSKEMAMTLPAVFTFYELVYSKIWSQKDFSLSKIATYLPPFFRTLPFWLLLLGYFGVRLLALGTFVGGYDDSLFFISNPREFINGWLHALLMFLQPINKSLIGTHHILSKLWPAGVVLSAVSGLANLILEKQNRRHFVFVAGWLVLCLIPVYKLFNISDDLQGSRLAYLATVPLCLLLTSGLLPLTRLPKLKIASALAAALMLILSTIILWTNNLPWRQAGLENNAIRSALQELYNKVAGDPQLLFLGLPDQIQGAYTCRNSLDGMTRVPQLSRTVQNCLMVNAFEPIFPFGFLKDSIAQNQDKILIYKWNPQTKAFDKISVDATQDTQAKPLWTGADLKQCLSLPEQKTKPDIKWLSDGALEVSSTSRQPEFLEFDPGPRSCFTTDFVEFDISLNDPAGADAGADLLYSNDMYPDFELKRRAHAHFSPGKKEQVVYFALHGLPEWSLGGKTHRFRLLIPAGAKMRIRAVALPQKQLVIPAISFANSGYFGTKGYIHLGPKQNKASLKVDVSKISGATKFALEVTRTNLLFEEQNPQAQSKVAGKFQVFEQKQGDVVLNYADFKSAGLYELRIVPLAADGSICGAASDHLAVSVD